MSWRTVVLTNRAKVKYSMVLKGVDENDML